MINPKIVVGAIDPSLLTLCKLWEPEWREPIRVRTLEASAFEARMLWVRGRKYIEL